MLKAEVGHIAPARGDLSAAPLERVHNGVHAVLQAHETDPDARVRRERLRLAVRAAVGARPIVLVLWDSDLEPVRVLVLIVRHARKLMRSADPGEGPDGRVFEVDAD